MDQTPEAPPAKPSRRLAQARLGCLLLAVLLVAVPLGAWRWSAHRAWVREQQAIEAHARKTNDVARPAMEALAKAAQAPDPVYDLDKTIRVIHQIDLALKHEKDVESYLRKVAVQDYTDVAPEVLASRRELMDILLRLYGKQVEAGDQQAMWEFTSELLLSTLSVVELSGGGTIVSPEAGFSVDRAKAQELLSELKSEQAERRQLQRDISGLERELIGALFTYSDVYFKYVREWDALSVQRDRAYLAAHNGDWAEVVTSARLAIEQAPMEREAHLLEAMALIELDEPEDDERVERLLSDYIAAHPDASAPAFLLLGVRETRRGRTREAQLAFQQAAAYYPKQAEALTDMLDPYKMRAFLRRSREGSYVVELYRSTMLGAGYFSPDLQLARALFDQGADDAARAKVLDHFARRRAQKQWDFILSDLEFCHDLLGPRFWEIFPEDSYLDLVVSPTLRGRGLNLSVNNRGARTLHNATLVLVLHFTDTYPGDYEAIGAGTQPAVNARGSTSFGTLDIAVPVDGVVKGVSDIVTHRAILIANEAVMWVDTDQYKIAESEEFREQRRAAGVLEKQEVVSPMAEAHPEFRSTVEKVTRAVPAGSAMKVESKYGKDNVLFELPRELALLRPIFRLRKGDELFTAADNVIEGDKIVLRFKSVDNWDDPAALPTDDLELVGSSPFGELVLTWTPGGDLSWRFDPYWSQTP